jgi:hypothetical protein
MTNLKDKIIRNHGLHIYSTTLTGKLAFLKNVVGIEEYDLDLMGDISVKEWAWK